MMGTVEGFGEVYYNPSSLANILSLAHVDSRGFRVTLDTAIEPAFIVHNTSTGTKKFIRSKSGLHCYNILSNNKRKEFTMIQTVKQNKTMFSKRELSQADRAMKIYQTVGRPGYKAFFDMLQKGQLHNCTVNMSDAKNAFQIYGPDEGALRGKTVRTTPSK